MEELRIVRKPVELLGAYEKATGKAIYAADLKLPGMLEAKVLRSPHAHAKILRIDTSKAEALPGVKAVVTAADAPDRLFGLVFKDEPIFARDKVRYKGERVAAVAAIDPYIAEEALDLIEVEYEPLPAVFDMEEAIKPGAPLIHEDPSRYGVGAFGVVATIEGNMTVPTEIIDGDVEYGFSESDLVVEERYVTVPVHQCSIETHVSIAEFSAGKLTVWTSTQGHFTVRSILADLFDLPMSKVRVIPMEIGGGFGGKVSVVIEPVVAILARKAGSSVRLVLTRQEEFEDTRPRAATITEVKTGVKKDGTFVARKVKFLYDNGAYADWGPGATGGAVEAARGPYRIPNFYLTGSSVYTNKFNTGPYRAPAYPQITFALESHVDNIAQKLSIDPIELRRKNGLTVGDVTFAGNRLKTPIFLKCLESVVEHIEKDKSSEPYTGWGIGCGEWRTGGSPAGAFIKVNDDGTVSVLTGATDLTGSKTSMAQVVAEELGLSMDQLTMIVGSTDEAPYAPGSGGSMVTYNMTHVLRLTAQKLRGQLVSLAAKRLNVPESELDLAEGKVIVVRSPDKNVSFASLTGSSLVAVEASCSALPPTHAFAVQAVKVAVDPETGIVTLLRAIGAQDCGTAINPQAVEGQISGGMAQAIGEALWEQVIFDEGGVVNPNFTDYRLPTALDLPDIEGIIVEGEFSTSMGHGCKGIGEPVHVPTIAAIANAIYAAVGVRFRELPITPEKIVRALKQR